MPEGVVEFNPVMTRKEVCRYLGVGAAALKNLIRNESLPFTKISGKYRFMKVLVDEWLKRKTYAAPIATPTYIEQ